MRAQLGITQEELSARAGLKVPMKLLKRSIVREGNWRVNGEADFTTNARLREQRIHTFIWCAVHSNDLNRRAYARRSCGSPEVLCQNPAKTSFHREDSWNTGRVIVAVLPSCARNLDESSGVKWREALAAPPVAPGGKQFIHSEMRCLFNGRAVGIGEVRDRAFRMRTGALIFHTSMLDQIARWNHSANS